MRELTSLKRRGIVITLFVIAMLFVSATSAVFADGPNVTNHTKGEIISRLSSNGASLSEDHSFATTPAKPNTPGELSNASKQSALRMLNNIRYIAGLPDVTLDAAYGEKAQAAAFVDWCIDELTHHPNTDGTKPDGMSDSLWALGESGASSSNIAWGQQNLNAAVLDWMEDADAYNIPMVGHRRWALNPKMGKVGFGASVTADKSYREKYYAEYSHDSSGTGTQTNVAWPAQKMPIEFFGDNIPWSLSTGSNITNISGVVVTLTRKSSSPSGSGSWTFRGSESYTAANSGKYFNVDNNYYGQRGCIIFRPDNISYRIGDIFDVRISGATSDPIEYTVEFFSGYPVETASFKDEVFYTSPYSWNNYLTLETTPKDADGFEVQWTSTNESVATVSDGQVYPQNPGTTTVTATIPGKYTKSGSLISTSCTVIVPKSITDSSVNISVKSPEFTGQVAKPIVTITDTSSNYVLEEGKDYTLDCSDEITYPSDGRAIVWISGKGAYSGGSSTPGRYYSVAKKAITTDMITLSDTEFAYNGQVQKPGSIVVKNGNLTLVEGTDYTVTNNGGKNAGTYNVTVRAAGSNYTSSANASFTIKPKVLTESMLVSGADLTYTGEEQTPSYSVKDNGIVLVKGTDYTTEVNPAINRGTYTYRTIGKGNYSGELEGSFTINPATISENDIELGQTTFEYDGSKKTPTVTVKVNNKTLSADDDYNLTIDDAVNRGSYKVTVTGKGEADNSANYIGGGNKTFEITAKPLTADMITLSGSSFVYNTETQKPDVTVKDGTKELSSADYELTNEGGKNTGEYEVVISAVADGNYSGSVTKKYSISQKPVAKDMLQLSKGTFTYNGETQKPDVTVKDGTKVLEASDYELTNEGGKNAGEYAVTLNGKGNYSGSASKTFTIGKLSIDDSSISASAQDVTYTGSEIVPDVTVSFGDKPLVIGDDFTVSFAGNSVNVGTVEATIVGKGNFNGQRNTSFNINKKSLKDDDVVFESIPQRVLEGDSVEPIPVIKYNGKTLTADDFDLSYEDNDAEGTGKVTVTGEGNFTGRKTLEFSIISRERADLLNLIAELEQARDNETDADFKAAINAALQTARTVAEDSDAASETLLEALTTAQSAREAAQTALQEKKDAEARAKAEAEAKKKAEEEAKKAAAAARAKQKGSDGTPLGAGASAECAEKAIVASASEEGPKGSKFAPLTLKSTAQTNTSVTLTWTKSSKAKKYVIYGNACGKNNKLKKLKTVTGNSCKITKISKTLKKGTYHKFMIVALNAKNNVVSTSKVIHVATKGGKVGNHKSVTIKAKVNKNGRAIKSYKALTATKIKKGKSVIIKTSLTPVSKKLPVKKHRVVCYESSNVKIATVNAKGKIVAKKKGTCYIFAYAQNGVSKKLKITVY